MTMVQLPVSYTTGIRDQLTYFPVPLAVIVVACSSSRDADVAMDSALDAVFVAARDKGGIADDRRTEGSGGSVKEGCWEVDVVGEEWKNLASATAATRDVVKGVGK